MVRVGSDAYWESNPVKATATGILIRPDSFKPKTVAVKRFAVTLILFTKIVELKYDVYFFYFSAGSTNN